MQWTDEAVIVSARKYGENALIINAFTRDHGLHAGLVRSIRKSGSICQAGNFVEATWKARLEEHLGSYTFDLQKSNAALLLDDSLKLSALTSLCDLLVRSLHEREPQEEIYHLFRDFIEQLSVADSASPSPPKWIEDYVRLELSLLGKLGYGLDLSCCAVTGDTEDLMYVSPRSGRAVSRETGVPYKNKLLKLPFFLTQINNSQASLTEIIDGMNLTGYFFGKHVFSPHGARIPASRERFTHKLEELLKG